ncbi:SIMPL domain-containing protein [Marinilabiliaceae bacterium JC017]|nr:SIMPL domain-containing protein [Marinilabiliaceae bacterium JC017]
MERTLVITGKGKLSVNPDLVIIKFPVKARDLNYVTAVEKLNTQVKLIRNTIDSLGVGMENLKTKDFRVNTLTRWNKRTEQDDFLGFSAQHDLVLEIPFDHALVNRIINSITKCDNGIEFRIEFGVRDKESCLKELLVNAIKNAKEKALIIAKTADVLLQEILNINYSFADVYFHSDTKLCYDNNSMMCGDALMPDINPSDIDMSENVTVTWRIE